MATCFTRRDFLKLCLGRLTPSEPQPCPSIDTWKEEYEGWNDYLDNSDPECEGAIGALEDLGDKILAHFGYETGYKAKLAYLDQPEWKETLPF